MDARLRHSSLRIGAALGCLLAAPVAAQPTILEFAGDAPLADFGWAVAGLDDVDGDGVPDLAVGLPRHVPGAHRGALRIVSGADGGTLGQVEGPDVHGYLGAHVVTLGDVDGDGVDDIATSGYGNPVVSPTPINQLGRVIVVSGATAQVLWQASSPTDNPGRGLGSAGDVDGNGTPDVVVGSPLADAPPYTNAGLVAVLCGATGTVIRQRYGRDPWERFGRAADGAGDVDGDGVPDIVASGYGVVRVLSGADLTTLHEWTSDQDGYGSTVAGGRDLSGDGVPDIAVVTEPDPGSSGHAIEVRCGDTGDVLWSLPVSPRVVALVADGDHDGIADLAWPRTPTPSSAPLERVEVRSGPTGHLVALIETTHAGEGPWQGLAAVTDRDGDGHDDVLVGVPGHEVEGEEVGRVLALPTDLHGVGPGPIFDLGLGLAAGPHQTPTPQVEFSGTLQPASPLSMTLSGLPFGTPMWVLIGTSWCGKTFRGGILGPQPDLVVTLVMPFLPLTLDTSWPAGVPAGLPTWLQVWAHQPTAENGVTASDAFQLIAQ